MVDAIEVLAASWSVAYKAIGSSSDDAAGIPTADLLSGRASRFGAGTDTYSRGLLGPDAAARRNVFAKAKGKLSSTFKGLGGLTGRKGGEAAPDYPSAAAPDAARGAAPSPGAAESLDEANSSLSGGGGAGSLFQRRSGRVGRA
jgi:hypothetical protein